ncbi:MAG: YdcF family protein [Sporomusaceae bacterium]|jgi:vancomycin permeability regulator SanA|nr:YdcF family protein [Sporomusaceae bacterium]
MKKHSQLSKQLAWSAICLCVAAGFIFLAVQWYVGNAARPYIVSLEEAPQADAVIILGAFVYGNDRPSPVLEDRLDYGYALYRAGKTTKIIVSGDHGTKYYDEVNAMKNYLIAKGVPRQDIFMDHAGFNTYDSMYRAKEIFGVKTLLISTQEFHIDRAVYIARQLGIDAYGYPSEDKEIYEMKQLKLRESLARVKAFWDADVIHRNPQYLGEAIPIMGDGSLTDG